MSRLLFYSSDVNRLSAVSVTVNASVKRVPALVVTLVAADEPDKREREIGVRESVEESGVIAGVNGRAAKSQGMGMSEPAVVMQRFQSRVLWFKFTGSETAAPPDQIVPSRVPCSRPRILVCDVSTGSRLVFVVGDDGVNQVDHPTGVIIDPSTVLPLTVVIIRIGGVFCDGHVVQSHRVRSGSQCYVAIWGQ